MAGVVTVSGIVFEAPAVVLTVGTFLAGRIHVGLDNTRADAPAIRRRCGWPRKLREIAPRTGRLKTGTPPRIDGRTHRLHRAAPCSTAITPLPVFSFLGRASEHPRQVPCHITHTNERTHDDHPRRLRPLADVHRRASRASARATAPRSRTRCTASPTRVRTRCSSSRRGSTPTRSIRTASPPACRSTCSASWCAASAASSART